MSGGRESAGRSGRAQRRGVASSQKSASVSLGRGSSLDSLGLLDEGTAGRVSRSDELGELRVGKLGVTVSVNASHDSKELGLGSVVAARSQEGTKVEGVDSSIVVAVNAAVGGKGREVVPDLELALEDVKTAHEVDLLLEDVEDGALDVVGEAVEATNAEGGTVQSDVAEKVVSARQKHLQEAIEAEGAKLARELNCGGRACSPRHGVRWGTDALKFNLILYFVAIRRPKAINFWSTSQID